MEPASSDLRAVARRTSGSKMNQCRFRVIGSLPGDGIEGGSPVLGGGPKPRRTCA
jgi:hypothetical protein